MACECDRLPLFANELDIAGEMFGIRFKDGGLPNGLIELYIEDDEIYHYMGTFNHLWLGDLSKVIAKALAINPYRVK